MDCIFCERKIFGKSLVHETTNVIVLQNIEPATGAHLLVIPKKHVKSLAELSFHEKGCLTRVVGEVEERIEKELNSGEGYTFSIRGQRLGQRIDHFHIHVIGMLKQDDLVIPLRKKGNPLDSGELFTRVLVFRQVLEGIV